MRFFPSAIILCVASVTTSALASPGVNERRARSVQCVSEIAEVEPSAAPKSVWSGDCGWDQLFALERQEYEAKKSLQAVKALRDGPTQLVLLRGAACDGWEKSIAANASMCGVGRGYLLQNISDAEVIVPLPGGYCTRYLPLLLTDKKSDFSCNAQRVRLACVQVTGRTQQNTEITLSSLPTGKGLSEQFRISEAQTKTWAALQTKPDAKPHALGVARISPGAHTSGLFSLLRATSWVQAEAAPALGSWALVSTRIHTEAAAWKQKCLEDRPGQKDAVTYCEVQESFHAERLALESIRSDQNIRHAYPAGDRLTNLNAFLAFMTAKKGSLTNDAWVFYNVITYSEIDSIPAKKAQVTYAYASPYQLLDAVTESSALSWGAKQIDFYGNDDDDVLPVFEHLKAEEKLGKINNFAKYASCWRLPLRSVPVAANVTLAKNLDRLNSVLHAPNARKIHDTGFVSYLTNSAKDAEEKAKKNVALRRSVTARMYYLDQLNQRGRGCGPETGELCEDPSKTVVGARHVLYLASKIDFPEGSDHQSHCLAERKLVESYDDFLKSHDRKRYSIRWKKMICVINRLQNRTASACKALEYEHCPK